MKDLNLILLILASLSFSTCKKSDPPAAILPPITQEGKNTIGLTIDGAVWVPYAKCGIYPQTCGAYEAGYGAVAALPGYLTFNFYRKIDGKVSDLHITTLNIGKITTTGEKADSILVTFNSEVVYNSDGRYSGPWPGSKFIITKLDKENQIISGEFELILKEQNNSGKTLILREGRFDFKFSACRCNP